MQFRVLGPVSVVAGDEPVMLGRGRRPTILAVLLAAEGAPVTTDRLVQDVWGDDPPRSARKSLQSHVSRLRAELDRMGPGEPDALVGAPGGYRMNLEDHELDATRFAGLVDEARDCGDPDQRLALLEAAEDRWFGPAFGDLASHGAIETAARRLDQLRAAATADRIDGWLERGRHDEALGELSAIVEGDPFDERSHGQLMRALVPAGRQAEALSVFERLRDRLRDQLGVDPSPDLQRVHEAILRQEETVLSARARGPVAGVVATPRGAGDRGEALLGRDRDVETLVTWVQTTSLLTLTGPGGVGKTRLAERVVDQAGSSFGDGVLACALANVRDAAGVGGALITSLGIQPTGEQTVAETLVSALGDRHLLLLLDNCEHVIEAVSEPVASILADCPNVTVLATSRERLRLPGERVWPVTPLDVPPDDATAPAVVAGTSAGALFELRAEAVEPTFALTADNAGAVAELCRRLDGMPLAIELAAARTRALAPADLVDRLDQRFSMLEGGPRHEGGRHRTLEAVVTWSYELLGDAEAELFDRLAVFAGGFPLDAIEAVCSGAGIAKEDVAGLLGELVDKSMVVVDRTGENLRYRLLDTMREFGLRGLAERGATEIVRGAHLAHYVAVAETEGARTRGPDEPAAVAAIAGAMDDLRAAHAWGVASEDVDAALRIPAALVDEVTYRLRDEVTAWARRALDLPGAAQHSAYAAALATAAMGATSRDEPERAEQDARLALDHARPDGPVALRALAALGTVALYEGRLDDVLELTRRQDELARALDNDYRRSFAGVCRVLGHLYQGQQDKAAAQVVELRRVAENLGNPTMQAFARYCDGETHLDLRPDDAATTLREAIELATSVDNRLIHGVSSVCLASLQGRRGQTREALELFRDVVAHWRRLGDHTHQLTTLRNLVELLAEVEADESAAILYGAVTAGGTPTFGAEAQRLGSAWEQVEERLGAVEAERLLDRGRRLGPTRMGDEALSQLDALLAE